MLRDSFNLFSGRRSRGERASGGGACGESSAAPADVYLDALDLRAAVLGDRVVLSECADGGFTLYRVADCRAQLVGWFPTAATAWQAIDSIDDEDAASGRGVSAIAPV